MIDALWCDAHGVFVKGWAHAYCRAPTAIHIRSGAYRATTNALFDRPDLQPFFPALVSTLCGFAVYLPCSPFRPVTLEVETIDGTVEFDVTELGPEHPINAYSADGEYPIDAFASEMKRIGGTVLEIGARVVGPSSTLNAGKFEPECKFIGLDIHEAPGVDIVEDAHFLSDSIAPGTIDGVFSEAVIEHLACPWLLAAQINKVLKLGGLTLHAVPHSFPIHETPNDFWRMSSEGLKVLFSPAVGFEVIEVGMADPVRMFIHPSKRVGPMLEFPLHNGMASSWILARKTFDLPHGTITWPLQRDESLSQSKAYPPHKQD
jgi:SAM-dependent methyltransferase